MQKLVVLLLMAVMLSGCVFEKCSRVAVLGLEEQDKAVIVFTNEKNKELKSVVIDYPESTFITDDAVYYAYSIFETNYFSYRTTDYQQGRTLKNVGGMLVSADQDGSYYVIEETLVIHHSDDSEETTDISVSSLVQLDRRLYILDDNNKVYIYNLDSDELISSYALPANYSGKLCEIKGEIGLYGESGITMLKDDGIAATYLYPLHFDELLEVGNSCLVVSINGEEKAYWISIENSKMILTVNDDESYFVAYDFEAMYPKYYKQGYIIKDYHESH